MENACDNLGGAYYRSLDICYKGYTDLKTWYYAFTDCSARAQAGTIGRLANVRSLEQWTIVKTFYDYWIGAKSTNLNVGLNWDPSEWNWYTGRSTSGPSLLGGYHPLSPTVDDNYNGQSCFRSKYENFKTELCYSTEKYVCEFIAE